MSERFDQPVTIVLDGHHFIVRSAHEAAELLADVGWPGERGPVHRDAYETCLKVIDGHRSAVDGRTRFIEAAKAAGILVEA